uniref:Small ribosomal subunit protein eS21 n=1 Tax=Pectinaria gouldii TaxID=260746 RepID=RS21_PECGU|nr:RecName: Full=Small ribosomal subunit protein eS21; AltName: Full=40S ribosomal protein S21 [Pectinaria gouldii]AAR99374.1 ribosomal protein S21 [Pectinaria gouldii]
MQNDQGEIVDVYIPRKCSATNNILAAKDHASVQINMAEIDPQTGRMTGKQITYALCGELRRMGEADDSVNRLAMKDKMLSEVFGH